MAKALEAAEDLAAEGIECEVIDPRTILPLDHEPIIDSVTKTNRAVIVHEAPKTGGVGGESELAPLLRRFHAVPMRHFTYPIKRTSSVP